MMQCLVRAEEDADRNAIFQVHSKAFGGHAEAELVDKLRAGGFARVSLVADSGAGVVGHVLFTPVTIAMQESVVELLSLAPMGVLPDCQRQGVGTMLMKAALQACQQTNAKGLVVLGHPDFYSRFGFSSQLAESLSNPFGAGPAWMALELEKGFLADVEGEVGYPRPFLDLT